VFTIRRLLQHSWCSEFVRAGQSGDRIPMGRDFRQLPIPALGSTQPLVQWVQVSFPGVKWPGPGIDHLPPSSTEVKGRVELYFYSHSGPSWPVLR
jgi:hypothetical protein